MEIDIDLKREGNQYNLLKIKAKYLSEGTNFLTYEEKTKGIYIFVTPSFKKGSWETHVPFCRDGSFKLLVKPLKRLSSKKLMAVQAAVDSLDAEEVRGLFLASNDQSSQLANFLMNAVKHI